MPSRRLMSALLLPVLALVVSGLGVIPRSMSDPQPKRPLRECPEGGHWTRVFTAHAAEAPFLTPAFTILPKGQIPLSREITDIVEFHDCQRFVVQENNSQPLHYSSLFAIFARLHLDSAYRLPRVVRVHLDSVQRQSRDVRVDPRNLGIPMATILAVEEPYDQLGIKQAFNCLYFFRTSTVNQNAWEARVVPVGADANACTVPLPRSDTRGKTLTVSVMTQRGDGIDEPPPVARWDWDTSNRLQYIGIRCGRAWCEVHPETKPGTTFSSSRPFAALSKRAKGWYDEQLLAVAHSTTGKPDEVSPIMGTIMPGEVSSPEFGSPENSKFKFKWRSVANVAIQGDPGLYVSKLNLFDSGNSMTRNVVSMCFIPKGAPNGCVPAGAVLPGCTATDGWFAKVWHASGPGQDVTKYFCVIRTPHDDSTMDPPPPVPNAPRWRWAIDDETMWVACLSGCCEVKAR
jgi:hypothetical protein